MNTKATKNLIRLLDSATLLDGSLEFIRDLIKPLNDYAVTVRYPGEEPNRSEAKSAIKRMTETRRFLRIRFDKK
jgi:hypothetical protein